MDACIYFGRSLTAAEAVLAAKKLCICCGQPAEVKQRETLFECGDCRRIRLKTLDSTEHYLRRRFGTRGHVKTILTLEEP